MSYLYISVFIMRENVLFSKEIFTGGKNFTLPAVPAVLPVGSDKYHLFLRFIHSFGELDAIQT